MIKNIDELQILWNEAVNLLLNGFSFIPKHFPNYNITVFGLVEKKTKKGKQIGYRFTLNIDKNDNNDLGISKTITVLNQDFYLKYFLLKDSILAILETEVYLSIKEYDNYVKEYLYEL